MAPLHVDDQARALQPGRQLGRLLVHLDEERAGLLRERAQRGRPQQPSRVDGHQVVAHALDLAEQVAGHDDGDAELRAGALDELEHLVPAGRVKAVGGLVEQEQAWVLDERLGQLDALLHARRVAAHGPVALLEQAHVPQHVGGALPRRGTRQARHARHVVDEVGGRDVGRQAVVLGHVADALPDGHAVASHVQVEDPCRSPRGVEEAQEDLDERRLAGPVGAHQADDAWVDREGQVVERLDPTGVALGESVEGDEGHAAWRVYPLRRQPRLIPDRREGAPMTRTHRDLVAASLRVIADGQAASGAFVASPTFSQYGYAWLRDGSFVAEGLDLAGEPGRAARFHAWVAALVQASADGLERARLAARRGELPHEDDYLHCRYQLDGRRSTGEWHTFQLDGPGIWLWSLAHHLRHGGVLDGDMLAAARIVARYLGDLWALPCADAWEEHPERVHTSTLAAIRAGLAAAVTLDSGLADDDAVRVAREGIDARLATFTTGYTKWPASPEVDASLLWMAAPYGSVAPEEPRFAATLARIEAELVGVDGGVHRYPTDTFYGGGAWPVLTSAYGRVLLRRGAIGDVERARAALAWIEAQADEDGRLPEQVAERALAPDRIDEWRDRWGESARPLLWSHAAYLALRTELARLGG